MNRTEIPRDNNVRWEWIKYQLRARGSSLAEVARSLDVSSPAVKNAKLNPYPRVERAIAAVLDLSPWCCGLSAGSTTRIRSGNGPIVRKPSRHMTVSYADPGKITDTLTKRSVKPTRGLEHGPPQRRPHPGHLRCSAARSRYTR
nr:helix-turn-helix domain-containing protein [Pseudomonas aeruginosa]